MRKFFGKRKPPPPPSPPLQTICACLPAKTPASLDLQICPEIEESAWREILKQSGACFFPSPDLTCPIWGSPFLQIFSFSLFACFSCPNYEACQEDPEIPASYFVHLILAPKSNMNILDRSLGTFLLTALWACLTSSFVRSGGMTQAGSIPLNRGYLDNWLKELIN